MVTMADVARAAGVSVMTVSNVLRDRGRVGEATRQRVLRTVAETGYAVNLTARNLRRGRADAVALIVPSFDHAYFGDLASRLAALFGERGLHLVAEQSGASREGELAALDQARLRAYDGVLLSVVGMTAADLNALAVTTPLVLLGEQEAPARFDHVSMANAEGARAAVAHLVAGGSRRIAVVGGEDPRGAATMATERMAGWRAALEGAGLAAERGLVVRLEAFEPDAARVAVREAIARDPEIDGVFAVTDQVAIGALAGLADAGLDVPGRVQVMGFDDLRIARHVAGGLSTVDPGAAWIAEAAADALARRMGDPDAEPRHLTAPARVVARRTTRPA